MSCALERVSPTVPFNPARSPPDAETSTSLVEIQFASTSRFAVVPLTEKSCASTSRTASSNRTRHVKRSALVDEEDGAWRVIEIKAGAVVSIEKLPDAVAPVIAVACRVRRRSCRNCVTE